MPLPNDSCVRITLISKGFFIHELPAGTLRVELASGHFLPLGDRRKLGACITSVALDGVPIAMDRAIFVAGFHEVEEGGHSMFRWTNGCGVLAFPARPIVRILELGVGDVMRDVRASMVELSGIEPLTS